MNEGPVRSRSVVETTDCLEAVGVFRRWKNFFFLIVLICLLLMQASFWFVDAGLIKPDAGAYPEAATANDPDAVINAASQTVAETDDVFPTLGEGKGLSFASVDITFKELSRVLQIAGGVLILTAGLYCLAVLFSLLVSLIGRLGGIRHISRAFFLSLIMLVLVIPWQRIFGPSIIGAVFSPQELATWHAGRGDAILSMVLYYLRFCGYWALVMLVLLLSQARSRRWTMSILRRLEIT